MMLILKSKLQDGDSILTRLEESVSSWMKMKRFIAWVMKYKQQLHLLPRRKASQTRKNNLMSIVFFVFFVFLAIVFGNKSYISDVIKCFTWTICQSAKDPILAVTAFDGWCDHIRHVPLFDIFDLGTFATSLKFCE